MIKSLILNIHSFVDLITNSSSETYVTADTKTVGTIKDILKLFLENANISTPVDEVFDVELVYTSYNYDTNKEEERLGTDECQPSRVRVTVKEGHEENFGELTKLMNKLNSVFTAQEFLA